MFDLVWLLFNIPVNSFSVMLGQSHCFLGIYQYFGELTVSYSRTLHSGRGVRILDLSLVQTCIFRMRNKGTDQLHCKLIRAFVFAT